MAEPKNPFRSPPQAEIDESVTPQNPMKEDLGEAVPLGEPEDEGFVIEEEDPEYAPPESENSERDKTK